MEDTIPQEGDGTNVGVPVSGPAANSPLISRAARGSGLRDIHDANTEEFLANYWTTTLTVTSHAVYRSLPIDSDLFTRSHNDSPWKEQGNIVFVCGGGKLVRTHGTLLNAILPRFVAELMEAQKLVIDPSYNTASLISLFVKGIEARCVEHFLTLCNKSVAFMTGREIMQMKRMIEVLYIPELSVFVAPPGGGISVNPLGDGNDVGTGVLALGTSVVAAAATSASGVDHKRKIVGAPKIKDAPAPPLQRPLVEKSRRSTRVKSNSSSDKNFSGGNAVEGSEEPKPRKKMTKYSVEFRERVLASLKSGATVSSVAQNFDVDAKTVSRWKFLAKKTISSDAEVSVQNQTTSGGPNSVERAAASASTVNSPAVTVDSSVQGQVGTVPVETPTIGFDSLLMRITPNGNYFIENPNAMYPQAMYHPNILTFNNMTMAHGQNESGAREDDTGKETV